MPYIAVMAQLHNSRSSAAKPETYLELGDPDREIRLFALAGGSADDELHGELLHCSLTDLQQANKMTFEALSYAWGDPNDTVPIFCRMRPHSISSLIWITKTLRTALKHLRLPSAPRLLWIDALCINQSDIPERNSQVRHMAEIYSSAGKVLVWLGESHEDNPFDAVKSYLEETDRQRYANVWYGFRNAPSKLATEALPLFSRPWFRRKWIIQEVFLAKEVLMQCGRFQYPFSEVERFIYRKSPYAAFRPTQTIYTDTAEFREMIHVATGVSNMLLIARFRDGQIDMRLANVLMETRHFECTDPRDFLFSVLSIAKDVKVNGIQTLKADYSMSLVAVISNATRWVIEHDGIDILSQVTGDDWAAAFGITALRSTWSAAGLLWAVNKSRDDLMSPLTALLEARNTRHWGKSPSQRRKAAMVDNYNVLHVFGVCVDQVSLGQLPYLGNDDSEDWVRQPFHLSNYRGVESMYIRTQLVRWWKSIQAATRGDRDLHATIDTVGQQKRLQEFGRLVFCGDLVTYRGLTDREPNYGDLLSRYEAYLEQWMKSTSPGIWDSPAGEDLLMEELDKGVRTKVITRTFCITKQGRLALLPPTARDGDLIYIFDDAQSPYLLRPLPDDHFALVGEAYVSGLMKQQLDDFAMHSVQQVAIR